MHTDLYWSESRMRQSPVSDKAKEAAEQAAARTTHPHDILVAPPALEFDASIARETTISSILSAD